MLKAVNPTNRNMFLQPWYGNKDEFSQHIWTHFRHRRPTADERWCQLILESFFFVADAAAEIKSVFMMTSFFQVRAMLVERG
jgi:hypothetical protein